MESQAPSALSWRAFVLVTPVKLPSSAGPAPSTVCASRRTRKSIIYDDEPEAEDPWLHGKDPWSTFRAPPGLSQPKPATTVTSPAASKLSQVRSELSAEVRQLVQESVAHGSAKFGRPVSRRILFRSKVRLPSRVMLFCIQCSRRSEPCNPAFPNSWRSNTPSSLLSWSLCSVSVSARSD